MGEKTIKNALFNIIKTLGSLLFPVITFSYASRIFLSDGMGRINFTRSLVAIFTMIARLGIDQYASRECAKRKDDRQALSKFFNEIIAISLISAILTYIILMIFIQYNQLAQSYRLEIYLFSITIFLGVFGTDWLFAAMEDYKYIAVRSLALQMLSFVLVLLFVHKREDIYFFIIIQVIAGAGANIFGLFHARKYIVFKKIIFSELSTHIRSILNLFLVILFIQVFTDMDTIMLGFMGSDHEVGLYSASYKISTVLCGIIAAGTTVILPKMAYAFEKGEDKRANEIIKTSIQCILFLGIPLSVGSGIFGKQFILIISGDSFREAAISARILSIRTLLSPVNAMLLLHYLIPKGKEKESIIITAIAAISNIILNYLFIPDYGAAGASLATVTAEILEFLTLYFFVRRYISFRFLFKGISQYCLSVIPVACIAYIVSQLNNHFLSIAIAVILSVPLYVIILKLMHNQITEEAFRIIREKRFM